MAESVPSPCMDWSHPDRGQAFKEFKQTSELWFKIKAIEPKNQHSYIILWSGKEGLRMFNTWNLSDEELKDPKNLWAKFSSQIEPSENFRIHRLEFLRYKQKDSETIDDFVTRCKAKAMKCLFKDNAASEERIIEVLIAGVPYPEVQKTLLGRDEKLTLQEAVDIGRRHEASSNHMSQFKNLDGKVLHTDEIQRVCWFCGTKHSFTSRNKCPAVNSKCKMCGKLGHWQEMCQQGRGRPQHKHNRSKYRHQSRSKSHGRQSRRSADTSSRSHHRKQPAHHSQKQHDIDFVREDFEHFHFETVTFIDEISGDNVDELKVNLDVKINNRQGHHTMRVKVDTGAQGNLLPLRVYRRMFPEHLDASGFPKVGTTRARHVKLSAYNGTEIPQYGSVRLPCGFDGNWLDTEFFVADAPGPILLGLPSTLALNLITPNCPTTSVHSVEKSVPIPNKETLQKIYPDRFEGIGQFPGKCHITLKEDAQPVIHPVRKYPIQLRDELKSELDRMESINVITKVTEPTDWVSSLAFSRKESGKLRVCLDPSDLNRSIKRTYHKTPTLEEITHKFSEATVFSKLDARHGYWSVTLDDSSSLLTTFNTPFGRYRFLRLPFGLRISQDIFQEKMDMILEQCPGTLGISDDTAVYGKTVEEHDRNLHHLMKVAARYGLIFNIDKCEIRKEKIKFFGNYYDAKGVHPDPEKIQEIQNLPPPANTVELQRFLGMIQYMSSFIPNLADFTEPLRVLTHKGIEWQWTESHQASFDKLKTMICVDGTLKYFNPKKPTVVQVDASLKGLGAVIMQDGYPIAYASKALTDTEKRYANIERELLAVVFGCKRFHTYVFGSHFVVESDHKPLESIQHKNLANTPPRLQRMMLQLQQYDLEIKYKPGKEMTLSDMLSRQNPSPGPTISIDKTIHHVQFSSEKLEMIRKETEKDETFSALKTIIVSGWPEDAKQVRKIVRPFWSCRHELTVEDGLLLKGDRVMIPPPMRREALQQLHIGHQGVVKCQLRAKSCIYWPGINKEIEELLANCEICQENQKSQPHESLLPHDIPQRPWQTVAMDLFHFDGCENLLITDYYSKSFFVRRIHGQCTSRAVIDHCKQLFGEQGIPSKVISDNGRQFDCEEFRRFAEEWCFDHVTSSPRYPQSNGFVERAVQTIKQCLTKAKQSRTDPDLALLSLRTTPIDSAIPSPGEILNGRKLQGNLPVSIGNNHPQKDAIMSRLHVRQQSQKYYHDRTGIKDLPTLDVGQKVLTQDQDSGRWVPGRISAKCDEPRSYMVETPNGKVLRRNRRHLRDMLGTPRKVRFAQDESLCDSDKTNQLVLSDEDTQCPDECNDSEVTTRDNEYRQYNTRSGRMVSRPNRLIERC